MRMVLNTHFTVKRFLRKYGIASAFLFLAFVGGYSIERSSHQEAVRLRGSQIEACVRGNILRAESNSRIAAHLKDRDTLAEFLRAAAKARNTAGTPLDAETAARYRELADSLLDDVKFDKVHLVNCQTTIPSP